MLFSVSGVIRVTPKTLDLRLADWGGFEHEDDLISVQILLAAWREIFWLMQFTTLGPQAHCIALGRSARRSSESKHR